MDDEPTAVCAECRQTLPAEAVIRHVASKRDTKPVLNGRYMEVVGFPSGMDGIGPPALREVPPGWHWRTGDAWVSWLADGTSRRYTNGMIPVWREGVDVCRACRDNRLA